MAEAIWLCTKAIDDGTGGQKYVDGISAVLINASDANTAAQTIAAAVAQCQAATHALPASYFESAIMVQDLTAGPLKDDGDCYIFAPFSVSKVEGS